ncbi:MAG: hypothetical protein KAI43_02440 [Candidatus Aureabacteria bacterium]|nr:hypothetical protein [Candidatus Auribacterota bacterium]
MNDATDKLFEIPSGKVDTEAIMKTIRKKIKEKEEAGIYHHYNLAKIHTLELQDIENEGDFLEYYLKTIGSTWAVDINDWEIVSKGGILGKAATLLKKIIWKLLKFYTYRLWSQQREFNAQISNTVNALHKKFDLKISELEEEIKNLKK